MSVTCPICETTVELIPDNKLRSCKCKMLTVDHDKYSTRYIGVIPKEDPMFENFWKLKSKECIQLRQFLN
jgi:endogenous inhibitor of DNA gyrase (YacG/DUF329 family)